jgi:hypothetical protein
VRQQVRPILAPVTATILDVELPVANRPSPYELPVVCVEHPIGGECHVKDGAVSRQLDLVPVTYQPFLDCRQWRWWPQNDTSDPD